MGRGKVHLLQNDLTVRRQIEPEHLNGAGGWCYHSEQHLNRGGFPRPIRAQQSKNFSRSDVERNIADGDELAELFHQMLDVQDRCGHE